MAGALPWLSYSFVANTPTPESPTLWKWGVEQETPNPTLAVTFKTPQQGWLYRSTTELSCGDKTPATGASAMCLASFMIL